MGTGVSTFVAKGPDLAGAVPRWSRVIGDENVSDDDATLSQYARTCIGNGPRSVVIIRPGSAEEVPTVVQIAAEHGVPIYPVSRGKNWGYGSACPVTEGQAILDLSRMNRIVEVNSELAYAVVEPGVSQQQLYEKLRRDGDMLMSDVTGAGPDASIVGNILERGFGHTPYGNRFAHTCGMEVVLADGRVLNTGFGAFERCQSDRVFPWGIGPWLDGLFTQSNFGIVTKLGIWLMPRPPVCQAFGFRVYQSDRLGEVITTLRRLKMSGVFRSNVHIANDLRVLSARMRYPWHLTNKTPLPDDIRRKLREDTALGAWNILGGLYGTKESVAASRKALRRAFRGLASVKFFDRRRISQLNVATSLLSRLGLGKYLQETLRSVSNVFDLINGTPSTDHLNGVAWRSRLPLSDGPVDPRDHGSYWLSPVLPMTAEACQHILSLAEPVFYRHKLEPLMTFTTVNERALCCVMNISFDKARQDESEDAEACYEELFSLLTGSGYIPYRAGIHSMNKLANGSNEFWDVCQQLKSTLDPENIIAPGRYQPSSGVEGGHVGENVLRGSAQ